MAVPDSLTSWREFVDRQPIEPPRMTMKQISSLSPAEKGAYDQQRFAWLAADVVLETHDTVALTRQTRIIMARNTAKIATARRGLAMSGSSGLGKSTAALLIGLSSMPESTCCKPICSAVKWADRSTAG
jgi:hypothetical protein